EFLKEHPSLKGKLYYSSIGEPPRSDWWTFIKYIHETQLDKQKVKEVIERLAFKELAIELKKELGLE
ncbi:hypothetical protein LCGC14_1816160, partial [marine sediment metagenome]